MLADARIGANVPVSNLEEAVSFYGKKLGLSLFQRGEGEPYARFAGAGETKLGVYDVRSVVDVLKAKGVTFEEYDMPGMKTEDGVAAMGDTRAAWLKDPDGNILEIVGG